MQCKELLTLGDICKLYPGLQIWQVRRIFERGILPEPMRIGTARVIHKKDMPLLIKALRTARYLPRTPSDEEAF